MMKRFLACCLVAWLTLPPAWGSLPSTAQWNVRTDGADTNGGSFDPSVTSPGTDYSQQASAQIAYTDLVIGATTTNYTSVANPVTSAVVGNTIQIVSGTGCTTGFYNIRSQAASVATVDRSMGTASSTCTANLGGALLTVSKAAAALVGQNTVNIKSGTYTITSALAPQNVAQTYIGYASTYADGGTKPLITTATNTTNIFSLQTNGGNYIVFDNLSLSNTAVTPASGIKQTSNNGNLVVVRNSLLSGFTIGLDGTANQMYTLEVYNTEIKNCTSYGIANIAGVTKVAYSYIHNNTTAGIYDNNSGSNFNFDFIVHDSVFYANGYGLRCQDNTSCTVMVDHSDFVNNTNDGIRIDTQGGSSSGLEVTNSVFYNNTGYGVNNANATTQVPNIYARANAYGSNGTAAFHNFVAGVGDVTLTANPFTNSGSNDFSLNTTSGGGLALAGAGFPGTAGFGVGYLSIGAVQPKSSTGTTQHAAAYVQ